MTIRLGVAGDPIGHSLSPFIHNDWLEMEGVDGTYRPYHIPAGRLTEGLERLRREGVSRLNITLPHKEEALRQAHISSETARLIGAANILTLSDLGWEADNTDAPGFAMTLDQNGLDVRNRKVFLLGAGGSARAVATILSTRGADLTICNRTVEKARRLAALLAPDARILGLEEGLGRAGEADLVINTLSLGQSGGQFFLPRRNSAVFYDISYGSGAAKALEMAMKQGWTTIDGLQMLVAQAALSYRSWFGTMPDMARALERCRSLLQEKES